jgi:hypothetical protein
MEILKNREILEDLEGIEFQENFLKPEKPAQVRNYVSKQAFFEKWKPDFLLKNYGAKKVGVFDDTISRKGRSFKTPDKHISFAEFLNGLTGGENRYRLFLFNLFKIAPELREDLKFPSIKTFFIKQLPFTFFGSKGSVTRIHQDMDFSNVFLFQIHGRKKVILFSPDYSELLYRLPFNVHTEVDITKPDYEKYPGLRYVTGTEYLLEPGDLLFIPAGWWHHIEYPEGGYSMSIRSISRKPINWLNGLLHVVFLTHIDELLLKIRGLKWVQYKNKLAQSRADQKIRQILDQVGDPISRHLP